MMLIAADAALGLNSSFVAEAAEGAFPDVAPTPVITAAEAQTLPEAILIGKNGKQYMTIERDLTGREVVVVKDTDTQAATASIGSSKWVKIGFAGAVLAAAWRFMR